MRRTRSRSRTPGPPKKKAKVSRSKSRSGKTITWSRNRTDARPSQAKPVSKKPTATALMRIPTVQAVKKEYHTALTVKQQDKRRESKFKQALRETKRVKDSIMRGIEYTAHVAGEVSKVVEPLALGGSAAQPEMAEFLLPAAGIADVVKRKAAIIEKTAKAAQGDRDAYKSLTDTGKYQKMMLEAKNRPKVNLIEYVPRAQDLQIEMID